MKKHTTTLVLLLFASVVYGQKVEFSYDAAGNRVLREYIGPPKIALNDPRHTAREWDEWDIPDIEDAQAQERALSEKTVVFPNPTRGEVTLLMGDAYAEGETAKIQILDVNGKEMLSAFSPDKMTQINLTGLRHGVYTLQLTTHENKTFQWKVVLLN